LIKIVFDGNVTLIDEFSFDNLEHEFEFTEMDYIESGEELHWIPYMEKKGIEYGLPF
jgi:hypothetical protein